jgi:hypothetical protein
MELVTRPQRHNSQSLFSPPLEPEISSNTLFLSPTNAFQF